MYQQKLFSCQRYVHPSYEADESATSLRPIVALSTRRGTLPTVDTTLSQAISGPMNSKLYAYKVNTQSKHTQQVYKTWYTPPLTFQTNSPLPSLILSLLIHYCYLQSIKMPRSLSTGKIVRPKTLVVSPTMNKEQDHDPVNREKLFASKYDPPS
jgi:hypothetical protein